MRDDGMINRRSSDDRMGNYLTLSGMLLTVILSVGGSWVTILTKQATQDEKIRHLEIGLVATEVEVTNVESRVDGAEQNMARYSEAIDNLVKATNDLTATNKELVIAVAKLEK